MNMVQNFLARFKRTPAQGAIPSGNTILDWLRSPKSHYAPPDMSVPPTLLTSDALQRLFSTPTTGIPQSIRIFNKDNAPGLTAIPATGARQ